MTPKPTLVEKMKQGFMTKQMRLLMEHGGLVGDDIQDSFMDRYLRAALAVVMAEMREPSEGMIDVHYLTHANAETVFADPADVWRAMLSVFEEDNK